MFSMTYSSIMTSIPPGLIGKIEIAMNNLGKFQGLIYKLKIEH